MVFMRDRPLCFKIKTNTTSGPGGLDALTTLLDTLEFDELQR
jgi:hypothetical protein